VDEQHDRRLGGAGRSVQVEVLFGRCVRPVGDVALDALRAQPGEGTERKQREKTRLDY
jgi:hypothetical protein